MEIERKWLVPGWPEEHAAAAGSAEQLQQDLTLLAIQEMRQGYISVEPTVRIREEKEGDSAPEYILCFKSSGGMVREEIEFPIAKENFDRLEKLIGLPLVPKIRKTYLLSDGSHLEVNQVDAASDTAFWYAEIEYASEEAARSWQPQEPWLKKYLSHEVTGTPGYSMGAYWIKTRLN